MNIGIFFASTSGRTRKVADRIAAGFPGVSFEVCELRRHQPSDLEKYTHLILGSPTYGQGDLHPDWLRWRPEVEALDLSRARVALFALGDQKYHGKTFAGALKPMVDMVRAAGAEPVGRWPAAGYDFQHSPALGSDGHFPGLVLDEVNQRKLTEERIKRWVEELWADSGWGG